MDPQSCHTRIRLPSLFSWIKAGNKCGIEARTILARHGIHPAPVYPDTRLAPERVLAVLSDCVISTRDDHFPLALGQAYAFEDFPDLQSLLLGSATVREFVQQFNACRSLIHPWARLSLVEDGDLAFIETDLPVADSTRHPYRYVIEVTLAMAMRLLGQLHGPAFALRGLQLRHADPPYSRHYAPHFGVNPSFDQTRYALVIDRALVDRPVGVTLAGPERARLQQAVNHSLALQQRDLPQEIDTMFRGDPSLLGAGMEEIARRVGLSASMLARHLKQEGARFSDIQEHVRHSLAVNLLQREGLSIQEISEQLGYPNRRAFTAAFKARTQRSPSQFRQSWAG